MAYRLPLLRDQLVGVTEKIGRLPLDHAKEEHCVDLLQLASPNAPRDPMTALGSLHHVCSRKCKLASHSVGPSTAIHPLIALCRLNSMLQVVSVMLLLSVMIYLCCNIDTLDNASPY